MKMHFFGKIIVRTVRTGWVCGGVIAGKLSKRAGGGMLFRNFQEILPPANLKAKILNKRSLFFLDDDFS